MATPSYILSRNLLIVREPGVEEVVLDLHRVLPEIRDPSFVSSAHRYGANLYALVTDVSADTLQNEIRLVRFSLPLSPDAGLEVVWTKTDTDGLFGVLEAHWFEDVLLIVGEVMTSTGESLLGNGFQARGLDGTLLWAQRGAKMPGVSWLDGVSRMPDGALLARCTLSSEAQGFLRADWPTLSQPPGPWRRCPEIEALIPEGEDLILRHAVVGAQLIITTHEHGQASGQGFAQVVQGTPQTDGTWASTALPDVKDFPSVLGVTAGGTVWVSTFGEDCALSVLRNGAFQVIYRCVDGRPGIYFSTDSSTSS